MDENKEKYNYLKINLIDKGFDINHFYNFLNIKNDSKNFENLSEWNLNELKSIVIKYKTIIQTENKLNNKEIEFKLPSESQINNQNNINKNPNFYQSIYEK